MRKEAYYRRDYQTAKQNVVDVCDDMQSRSQKDIDAKKAYPNITDSERKAILDLFEKYWKLFAGPNSQPCAALIERGAFYAEGKYPYKSFQDFQETFVDRGEPPTIGKAIDLLRYFDSAYVDSQTQKDISPVSISIIQLPEYSKVNP